MADKNIANGIRSETAPTNVKPTTQTTKAGEQIVNPDELSTLTEQDIARTTSNAIYRRDLAKEQKAMPDYIKKFGAPKTDADWRKFHENVYGKAITPEDQKQLEDEARAEEKIIKNEEKMTDAEREANKQRQIAEGVAKGEPEYMSPEEQKQQQNAEEMATPTISEQLQSIQDDMDTEMQAYIEQFNIYTNSLSEDSAAAIQNIKNTFDRRREQTKQINNAVLNSKKLLGVRSGRQKYAGEIQSSIISSEEQAGISRLADLDMQEKTLVMQARYARNEKQWTAYNQLFNKIQENQDKKRQIILDLNTIAMNQEKLNLEKLRDIQNEKMDILNYNLQAERVGMEYSRLDRDQANQEIGQLANSGFTPEQFTKEEKASYEKRLGLPEGTFDGFMRQLNSASIKKQLGDEIAFNNNLMELLDKVPSDSMINIGGSFYQGTKQDDMYIVRETDAYGNVTVMGINEQTGEVKYAENLGRIGKGFSGGSRGWGMTGGVGVGEGEVTFLEALAQQAIDLENSLPDDVSRRRAWDELMASAAASKDVPYSAETLSKLVSEEMSRIKTEKGIVTKADIEKKSKEVLGEEDNKEKNTVVKKGAKTREIVDKAPKYIKDLALETGQTVINFIGGFLGKDKEMITNADIEKIKQIIPTKKDFLANRPTVGPINTILNMKGLYNKYLK